jgi:hypothetical protein
MRRVSEARLRGLRQARQERRRSESHYFGGDDDDEEELVEDFVMNGICCAEPEYDDHQEDFELSTDQSARRQSERPARPSSRSSGATRRPSSC